MGILYEGQIQEIERRVGFLSKIEKQAYMACCQQISLFLRRASRMDFSRMVYELRIGSNKMKVVFISPSFFADKSVVGGGERYACELAKKMSDSADVTLVSFAEEASSRKDGRLALKFIFLDKLVKQ